MRARRRSGFTLIEVTISLSLVATVLFGLGLLIQTFGGSSRTESVGLSLSADALEILATVTEDLGRSGFVTLGGEDYPLFFPAGEPPAGFEDFEHEEPHRIGDDPEESREILFPMPADADGDNWPDMAGSEVAWEAVPIAYLLVPADDGTNTLIRRGVDGVDRTISRSVQEVRFEDPEDTGWEIPLNTVRVTVVLGAQDFDGRLITREASAEIALMNGWIAQ